MIDDTNRNCAAMHNMWIDYHTTIMSFISCACSAKLNLCDCVYNA
jgi:hypothetical protein